MDIKNAEAAIEGILFTLGEAVSPSAIALAVGLDVIEVERMIHNIQDRYEQEERGIQIIEVEKSYQMCTKPDVFEYLIKLVNQPRRHSLSDVVLETLSIVAYKQPVTRQEIEAIRGVKSDHAVNKLIEYNLIEEVGRLDAIGKPILFGTTQEFLRCFGVPSIDDLPIINPTMVEDLKQEAEEEIQMTLDI